ncbi:extracellular solute-binding protein [Saccharicrinis fermentans]|uniref:Maltose-binding periplasmic protein n=1 Tax=Saccharicrinis fermentans DSM 9555 = JCM 21142 TaxID=869213 RepID=W7YPV7_9BACT|nr:extracellular solute-binding protein [Saccharicrinis fermentans]GAF04504.1 maltose-binding periplasmic protein [Saccharicrinis fermentans DSM 9555 = JCM 21142]
MNNIKLKGITWNHSRGFTSIVACAQRFSELNPGVEISWEKRSLQAFADEPIDQLAERFDFLIIDHPWTGFAARSKVIIPLSDYLPSSYMEDQAANAVGKSFESYHFSGKQWALPIDAATPVAASRPDLFESEGWKLPKTWDALVELSKTGKVAIPGIPQDILMSFYMLCSTLGEDVCVCKDCVVSDNVGIKALQMLRDLGENIKAENYDFNPIKVYEKMTLSDDYLYSPFAYGYTNYSRRGYARKLLKFHDMVALDGQKLITTLGGTGLAVSANCKHREMAVKFAEYAGSSDIQRGIFFTNGGQPGHRAAWLDQQNNADTMDFFVDTLPALDRSFLRPRYYGHMYFQDRAGAPIREYMMKGGDETKLLAGLNELYYQSLELDKS